MSKQRARPHRAAPSVWATRFKWPDVPHYSHRAWLLGADRQGQWYGLRPAEPIHRGNEVLSHTRYWGLLLVPHSAWWQAWFIDSPRFDLYIDICTPHEFGRGGPSTIDLDLDVVRWSDGRVELVDEDEFAEHQLALGYPRDVVTAARTAADEVVDRVTQGDEPFAGAAELWWSRWHPARDAVVG